MPPHISAPLGAARPAFISCAGALRTYVLLPACLAGLLLLALIPHSLVAQTTDASIMGTAHDSNGTPLADVAIEARNTATGFIVRATTNTSGRFAFLQLALGGPYIVTARRIGYVPSQYPGITLGLGDRVEVGFTLIPSTVVLEELVASSDSLDDRASRIGGNSRFTAEQLAAMPTVNRNFTDLSALAPTVGPQQSVGGARWTATNYTIDGAQAKNMLRAGEDGAGPFTISLEAIQEFEVNTNVYDVSQGRAGGGTVSAATRSGTNSFAGSVFAFHRDDNLSAATDFLGRSRDERAFNTTQWGGSVGGPILKNKLLFFAAFERFDSRETLFIADVKTDADEIAAGISRDSLARMLVILQEKYGQDPNQQQVGAFDRSLTANTAFGRLDWSISPSQTLTVRYNYTDWDNPLSGGVDQPLAIYDARSDFASAEQQALASLRSSLAGSTQNDLRFAFSSSSRTLTPISPLPRGFVRIRSDLPDGTIGDVRVQFGGNRLAPDISREWQYQLADQLVMQKGKTLLSLGTDNTFTLLRTYIAESQSGLFEFDSLGALDALKASRYSRSVPLTADSTLTRQTVLELGVYAQAEWRASPELTVTGGLRWDASAFLTGADYNALVDTALGFNTTTKPQDWFTLEPRAQAVWLPGTSGRNIVRAGGGLFTSQLPYYEQHNQLLNDGLTLTDLDLRGAAVPIPDYPGYAADPSTIPGVPAGTPIPPSYVNVIGTDFKVPLTWKLSVAYQHAFSTWLTLTGTLLGAWTSDNYYYVDENLVPSPAFTLGNEENRPVFVPASTIDALGRTNNKNALAVKSIGRVLGLTNVGSGHELTGIIEATIRPTPKSMLQVSYTRNNAEDNTTFGCCLARTSTSITAIKGDPRDISTSWGPSDLAFTNKLVIAGSLPPVVGFVLSVRYVGISGRPFSAVVNGDINGDEVNGNDLAFVFDPDDPGTPADVAAGMRKVLDNPDNVGRDYLLKNLGQIASRNGASAPWNSRVDLRLARAFHIYKSQALELTIDVFNFLNLLNSSWGGQYLLPLGISTQNPVTQRIPLLNVVGFDQATQRYRYTVNENFGVLQKQGDPYNIQIGGRYIF